MPFHAPGSPYRRLAPKAPERDFAMSQMPAASPSSAEPSRVRRRRLIILTAIILVILVVILFIPQAFNIHLSHPNIETTWALFLLSTLSFLGIVILTLVLLRQILKLYAERRANILGSKFKTKLVIGALGLSLIPVVCMFAFTYGLINRTLEKWFSRPVEAVRDDTREILDLLTNYVQANATNEAASIAQNPNVVHGLQSGDIKGVRAALALHQSTLDGGFVLIVDGNGHTILSFQSPRGWGIANRGDHTTPVTVGNLQYIFGSEQVPQVRPSRFVQVAMPVPPQLTTQMGQLKGDYVNYARLAHERRSLRFLYTGYLLLLTLAILFGATWFALFLSKLVIVPIQALATATQEISRGNLSHRVKIGAKDEIGALVSSFNTMAEELETGRGQIEASRRQLQRANAELETRRRYTETLLENIPSAVLSLDRYHSITRINPAVFRLFGPRAIPPQRLEDLFPADCLRELRHLLRRSERLGAIAGQMEVPVEEGRTLTAAVTVASIPSDSVGRRSYSGYVLVLDDLTDLLRVQRVAAWREVARRIAHEIKNPLTPISLSAQRIRRRVERYQAALAGAAIKSEGAGLLPAAERDTLTVIAECADTITAEVRSLQHLVDEFSAFARFPAARPMPCNLNEIIEGALRAFDGRLDGITLRTQFRDLPTLRLDPEEMKRVFINLIDNAAEAVQGCPYREIQLSTTVLEGLVEAVVADTGRGVQPGDKERMFLPYFSTKGRGSGLGLAIVTKIAEDHGGSIRVEENQPVGARFILELPVHEMDEPAASNPAAIVPPPSPGTGPEPSNHETLTET